MVNIAGVAGVSHVGALASMIGMRRFDPVYWTCNFNTTCAASVVATAVDAMLVTCNFRTNQDLAGIYWWSTDTFSHPLFQYETNNDYSSTTLDFDFVIDNIRALDAVNGPTLAVTHLDTTVSFVRLSNFITSGTPTAGHIHLDMATAGGGFFGTDPIDWTDVDHMLLSLIHDSYKLATVEIGGSTAGPVVQHANATRYARFVATVTGDLKSCTILLTGTTGSNVKAAIYDDAGAGGTPGAVIATTFGLTGSTAGANTLTFSTSPTLTASATYYLAIDQDGDVSYEMGALDANCYVGSTTYGSFPEAAPSGLTGNNENLSGFSIELATDDTLPLDMTQVGTFTLTNMAIGGPILRQKSGNIAPHKLRLADGYDDSYYMTPSRIVKQMHALGYRDWYSIYMGISHHHDIIWDADESRFVVNNTGDMINDATRTWFTSLLAELESHGFTKINISVSYEIVNFLMPTAWRQEDADGNPGLSGWSPPSEFISPCNFDGLNYLRDVLLEVLGLFSTADRYFQVGEPWWWDNSFTTHQPCFYDATTVAAYTSETGLPVPTPYITSTSQSIVGYEDFLSWLGDKLGTSTNYIKDQVQLTYPAAKSTILFYTPQIFSTVMLRTVNLPISHWEAPNWDLLQLEDYDWIINADWTNHATTWVTGTTTLGYTSDSIHYFSGFNLMPGTADLIWRNTFIGIRDGYRHAAETWVWARPQVFRDNILWTDVVHSTVGSG